MITFDKNISGKVYVGTGGEVALYTLRSDGYFAGTYVGTDVANYLEQVTLTGWKATSAKGTVGYQTTTGEYIIMSEGWSQYKNATAYGAQSAQRLVNTIIENNKTIIANNLLCARYAEILTAEQRDMLRSLQLRLEERNNALMDAGVLTGLSTSYPAGYAELQPYLTRFMSGGSASGVGSVTVAIIVTAVVIASLSTAAYFAYKAYAAESENDVKYSKELTKILTEKLTPEEYQQLLDETKGIVTKARIMQSLGSYGKVLSLVFAGVGGYFLYKWIKNYGR